MLFVFLYAMDNWLAYEARKWLWTEFGIIENLQVLKLLLCVLFGLILLRSSHWPPYAKGWFSLGVCGVVFVLLEEISYGQHYIGWISPDFFIKVNNQQETNLHNISSWLDQKPRFVLEVGVLTCGVLLPLLQHRLPGAILSRFHCILPPPPLRWALFVTSLIALVPSLYERFLKLAERLDLLPFQRTSEVQELFFYYFILLYFILLNPRFNRTKTID